MATSNLARAFTLLLLISSLCEVNSLRSDYYRQSCPAAEATIARVVRNAVQQDRTVGPGMLRLIFHDCFVQGCDASILIDSPSHNAEKDSIPNQTLAPQAYKVIDQAKAAVEAICRQTVSCADVVAFAASTSLTSLGGPTVDIQGGRFDGLVSSIADPTTYIPSPFSSLSDLETKFGNKGLNIEDLVVLSGAHTVGKANCSAFSNRLGPNVDPSLDAGFAASLKQQCSSAASTTLVNNDIETPTFFDNKYYQDVAKKEGLFTSDAQLYTSSSTKKLVDEFAANNFDFLGKFANSLVKMGQIGVKTSKNGNIRTNCRSFR